MTGRWGDRERGSAAIEAVIAIPAFVLFVVVIIAAGRVAMAIPAIAPMIGQMRIPTFEV